MTAGAPTPRPVDRADRGDALLWLIGVLLVGCLPIGRVSGDGLGYAWRLQHPRSITAAPWVGSSELRVAAEVGHLLVGGRRIEVPGHGRLIVAWKSRSTGSGGLRPLIVAGGRDGSELSRIGPHDSMDSYTWAKVSGQQE